MAHGDGAAVHVDLVMVHVEGLHEAQHDRGERLVHLEQVDIADLHPAVGEDLLVAGTGRSA
jgi:hypothetical protein